jgi:transcriptional regulator with XRE-family HTH domain
MQNLKDVIKNLANKKGLSQRDLAAKIGITEAGYIRMYKKGTLKVETLKIIANALDVSILTLLTESDQDLKLEMMAKEPENTYGGLQTRVKKLEEEVQLIKKIVLK